MHILKVSGDAKQRRYAEIVEPIRRKGHLLLSSLLIANMLVNEAMPIVLDDLLIGGWQAIMVSTALIVFFGEIIPQAICSRYGLAIGAHTAWYVCPIDIEEPERQQACQGDHDHILSHRMAGFQVAVILLGKS